MEKEMQIKKNKINATVLTFAKELGIDMNDIPAYPDLDEFSVEDLLGRGEIEVNMFMARLNQPDRPDKDEMERRVKRLAGIWKAVKGREKPKSRAEMAADKAH